MIMYMVQVQRSELRSCRSLLPRLRGQMVASGSNSCTLCWMMPDSTKANSLQLRMFYDNVHGPGPEIRVAQLPLLAAQVERTDGGLRQQLLYSVLDDARLHKGQQSATQDVLCQCTWSEIRVAQLPLLADQVERTDGGLRQQLLYSVLDDARLHKGQQSATQDVLCQCTSSDLRVALPIFLAAQVERTDGGLRQQLLYSVLDDARLHKGQQSATQDVLCQCTWS